MSAKAFPLSKKELDDLAERYPTPFYLYDEKAIRENARRLAAAFSAFPAYKEHFAVKALPNPCILKILAQEGMGADCSSLPELLLADMAGVKGEGLMFSSNETPAKEYLKAAELGAVINLDDFTHIDFLEKALGKNSLPEIISCRYNPGPLKEGNAIIGRPEEAKYGFTREQLFEGYKTLKEKGVRRFGLHAMVASNELSLDYHLETGRLLFELAVEIKSKCGITLEFINLGGGLGIPYRPEQEAVSWEALALGLKKLYDQIIINKGGLGGLAIRTEYGRPITGPYGWLVSRAVHKKEIYRDYIGLDACMADLMRPALYNAYHHITIPGKENAPLEKTYDIVGSLCENNDKFAVQRRLPKIDTAADNGGIGGDFVIIHDAGAHGRAMGFNYNGKLRCKELLLRPDGSIISIRRAETVDDYFATLDLKALEKI
ncbi:MAG: diaminopimelate decarboxylase [Treponema sp.]|jgi:diaminopimelate decarboxylase|nr:diaminopimelate decarboxylase [Treponema sp.]